MVCTSIISRRLIKPWCNVGISSQDPVVICLLPIRLSYLIFSRVPALKVQSLLQTIFCFLDFAISLEAAAQIVEGQASEAGDFRKVEFPKHRQNLREEVLALTVKAIIKIVHAILVEQLGHFNHLDLRFLDLKAIIQADIDSYNIVAIE